jgi:hypothetical protein
MEAGAAVRAARGQRRERVTDWPLIGAFEYTLSHPLVVDLLTVARSRLHEVINDQMESPTELLTDFADQPMPLSRAERR